MSASNSITILIIEDEPIFRINYRTVLTQQGYTVKEAHNGRDGIQMLATLKPDVILLDLILPEINGYEVLKKIRELKPSIPVIVFSVLATESERNRAYALGANDYVVKGMESPTAILEKITAVL
jgi:two-component system KDP operon response regulator KdpE